MKKRGQASVELLVVLAIALLVLLSLLAFGQGNFVALHSRIEAAKAEAAVNDISAAAENVYQQGSGSKMQVYISMPEGVQFTSVANNTFRINILVGDQARDMYRVVPFAVSGTIPLSPGPHWIFIESKGTYVTSGNDTTSPSIFDVESAPLFTSATIRWNTDETADSRVYYNTNLILSQQNGTSTLTANHAIQLSSLQEDRQYFYLVQSCDAASNCANSSVLTFTTLEGD